MQREIGSTYQSGKTCESTYRSIPHTNQDKRSCPHNDRFHIQSVNLIDRSTLVYTYIGPRVPTGLGAPLAGYWPETGGSSAGYWASDTEYRPLDTIFGAWYWPSDIIFAPPAPHGLRFLGSGGHIPDVIDFDIHFSWISGTLWYNLGHFPLTFLVYIAKWRTQHSIGKTI